MDEFVWELNERTERYHDELQLSSKLVKSIALYALSLS